MKSRDFAFWLQGLFEVAEPRTLSEKQTDLIRRHLALVFKHEIDPSMPDPTGELQAVHDGFPYPVVSSPSPGHVAVTYHHPKPPPTNAADGEVIYRC